MKKTPESESTKGKTWKVELRGKYVIKTPHCKVPSSEIISRYIRAKRVLEEIFRNEMVTYPPIPKQSVKQTHIRQAPINGRPLAHLKDEEILELPEKTKSQLVNLLLCNEIMKNSKEYTNFIDLFGYDDDLPWLKKIIRSLNVRYSTNIMVGNNGNIYLFDIDEYLGREERGIANRALARIMTPVIFMYIRSFRKRLMASMKDF